jgi:hypothetical protein
MYVNLPPDRHSYHIDIFDSPPDFGGEERGLEMHLSLPKLEMEVVKIEWAGHLLGS